MTILPEPVQAHWLIALMAVVIPAVRTGLGNDTIKLPTVAGNYRALIVALLAGASTLFDGLMNGFDVKASLSSFLILSVPSIVQELIKVVFGAGPSSGKGSATLDAPANPGGTSMRPPAMKMVAGFAAAVAFGCAALACAAKPIICPVLDVAAEVCPLIAVKLPDGTTEMVRREDIAGVAMQARAARLAKPGASDAGAEH